MIQEINKKSAVNLYLMFNYVAQNFVWKYSLLTDVLSLVHVRSIDDAMVYLWDEISILTL